VRLIHQRVQIFLLLSFLLSVIAGCGVKGDPVPPATPADIGRGKPLFRSEEDDSSAMPKRKTPVIEQKDEQENDNE
jgi:predicted small lipoprotein YifL